MKPSNKLLLRLFGATSVAAILTALPVSAANISMTASDNSGASSLTSAGKWSNAQAPSAANDYFSSTFFIRTPADAGGITTTFAGNSLTLQAPSGQAAPMRSILFKGGANDVIVINNLTNAGGIINMGSGSTAPCTFTGNAMTVIANSTMQPDQASFTIGYPIFGSAILTNISGANRTVTYTGNLSGFTGKFYIFSSCTLALNSGSSNLGNPATFTPDQIMIGNGCTFLDNIGLTFNNANSGITLLGPGNATINAASTTVIAEPITDATNGVTSVSSLTKAGAGTLTLSAANTYSGGTTISAGTLQIGNVNALTNNGAVTDNSSLDLNGYSITIGALGGSGTVDNSSASPASLTIGNGGGSSTFSGTIQNSSGTLSLTKIGAGTFTLSGGYTYSGTTLVAGGTINLNTAGSLPSTAGDLITTNGATLNINASSGISLPAANIVFGTNTTANVTLISTATGLTGTGNLTFQDNSTNTFTFVGALADNPSAPVINVSGGISAPGTTVVINIAATGLKTGTFTLIKYGTGTLASIANFQLNPPPGVAATLINNTANQSIDLQINSTPTQLAWNGVNGTAWDLSTPNWADLTSSGITVFQQYTNGSVIAGDSVRFDDTLTNDFVNPQPTNIVLNSQFYAFPMVFDSTLPYSISGSGGILGVTSLVVSNTGSLTLLTSNAFTGGVTIAGASLVINSDSALGASSGSIALNGGTLQMNGGMTNSRAISMPTASTIGVGSGATARLGGVISGAGALNKTDNGTLILAATNTFTGDLFLHAGTTILDGSITNGSYHDVGQNGTDNAVLTLRGTGSFGTTSDFNVGDLDSSAGVLNISNSAALTANAIFIGSANASGSTASGIVNQAGGTVTQVSTAVGTFAIGGRASTSGVGVYNLIGGTVTANAGIRIGGTGIGTLNQSGGTLFAKQGINIARIAGSFGTNNLNGGVLSTFNISSSTGTNAVFNFNGGTLQANFTPGSPWFSTGIQANILAGGAFIDSSNFTVSVNAPLLAGSPNGGLTKLGTGTLTLNGLNTYTGSTTNNAGKLIINSAVTNTGGLTVNAGLVQFNSATSFQGPTVVNNGATLSLIQTGSAPVALGNMTLNGAVSGGGAVISLTPGSGNNPSVAMLNCGTLTLNGTNTIALAAVNVGTSALLKYTALAGSGNCTNLTLPQGAIGFVSNSVANSTLYAVITSTGPGLVWTGTNTTALNLWDINSTTNWTVNGTPTSYHQIVSPGDAVIFNDIGSGTVTLNTNVAPAGITISNNSKAYTFSGTGGMSGSANLVKVGTGTAIVNLTNNTYAGSTVVSNGTLQIGNNGVGSSISPSGNLIIGPSGTLSLSAQLANVTTTIGEFTGSGSVSYTGGNNSILAFGGSTGGTWNGSILDAGGGGLSLTKSGTGTWFVGGSNYLNNGDAFNAVSQVQLNGGTTVITNSGLLAVAVTEFWIGQGAGSTSTVVVAGGTLAVSNNWLCVGRGDATANGKLIVNSGTVLKAGNNNIVVGSGGATGTLIVNGGQVLNNGTLWLGENATGSGTLELNGGLVQASVVQGNNTPAVSIANFNGGTLQATANSSDFLQVSSMIMSNGLVLDDGGFAVTISSQSLQSGDAFNGGLVKKGAGAVYLNSGNSFTGTTVVTNGLLAGIGSVSGPAVVAPAGRIGAGDATASGSQFTINNNLTVQGGAFMRINKTGGSPSQDQIVVNGNVSYGGILTVSNATSDATVLAQGDSFQLFNVTGTKAGNFSSISGSPGSGLAYSFDPSSGVLSVVAGTASNPTNITVSVSGNTLSLSWPTDHLGWILQQQTNSLSVGLASNWVDVAGSASITSTNITINPASPAVFYRLRKP